MTKIKYKIYYGHHATSKNIATKIIETNHFEKSTNDIINNNYVFDKNVKYHWLGNGIYFWDDDIDIAKLWGKQKFGNKYAVLLVPLKVERDRVFDLRKEINRKAAITLIKKIIEKCNNFEELDIMLKNRAIGFACELMQNKANNYDLYYNDFQVSSKNQISFPIKLTPQICVTNDSIIQYNEIEVVYEKGDE